MTTLPAVVPVPLSMRLLASLRRFVRWVTSAKVALSLIMLVLMFYLVIIPLYRMVVTTVTYQGHDLTQVPGAVVGELTTYHYVRMLTGILGKIYTYTPLWHSLTIATGATLLALLIGGVLAWLAVRTDMPGRKLINQLAVIPYIMPSWTLAQAWLVFFKGEQSGGTAGVFEYLVGSPPPVWLSYGPVPIILCSALHYYTFFFLFVSAALMSIDSNLEEAGELAGASRRRILWKITFPLVMPAILSGFIMTFSKVMGTFGGPNLLGVQVNYYVVATMIRGSINNMDTSDAFVLAIVLVLFSIVVIGANQKLVGTRKSYETIGGRGFVSQVSKLGRMQRPIMIAAIVFQIMVIVVPLGLLVYSTFMLRDGNYSLSNLSLQHWVGPGNTIYNHGESGVLLNPKTWKTAWNSVRLSLWTAFFTALFGILLGYSIVKGRGTRLSKVVEQLAFIPYVIPGIAFGAVYIAMFSKRLGPLPALYGTFSLLVVVSVVKHLPYSSRSGVSAMMQVGRELEEAGQIAGANVVRRFMRLIFPLTSSGFISGFLLTFITTMRELSLIILLTNTETQVLASQTMQYTENGDGQMANCIILILIALVSIGHFFISRLRGGSLRKGLGM